MKRSKIEQLPPELKEWLDEALVKSNFQRYSLLVRELKKRGAELGLTADVSKSGLHRYGTNLERKLSAITASTQAAALFAKMAPDDADLRSGAVISLIQTDLFNILVALQDSEGEEDPTKRAKLLSTVAKNVATLSRASGAQKRHEMEVRTKVSAAADAAVRVAKKGGISKAGADELFRVITGIAT